MVRAIRLCITFMFLFPHVQVITWEGSSSRTDALALLKLLFLQKPDEMRVCA